MRSQSLSGWLHPMAEEVIKIVYNLRKGNKIRNVYLSRGDLACNFSSVSSHNGFETVDNTIKFVESAVFGHHSCEHNKK